MTTFTVSAEMAGVPGDALQSAVSTLTNNGFAITARDATSVSLTGPGLNSTKQNPILGVSKITLRLQGSELTADAELGGVDAMQRFLMWFPFLLGLVLGIVFTVAGGLLFGNQFGIEFGVPWAPGWRWSAVAFGGAMLPVTPWLILSPLMARGIRNRTQAAIITLVQNAAFVAEPG